MRLMGWWVGGLSKCTRIQPLWGGETGEGKLPQPGDPRRGLRISCFREPALCFCVFWHGSA